MVFLREIKYRGGIIKTGEITTELNEIYGYTRPFFQPSTTVQLNLEPAVQTFVMEDIEMLQMGSANL